ncbi:hypothetical protein [Emcibacter sp. SYSU 3D8]|uniref:beta strand repeat-containing protein n=1 Tax=Emcibacter sp. SYSU 3D8 TaxID=3133969 RepID=UPI0031FE8190
MNRILATVSVMALATATGITGARADNVLFDLTGITPSLSAAAASASVVPVAQANTNTDIISTNTITLLGTPVLAGALDVDFGTITDTVDDNEIYADAIGNTSTTGIDLNTATGSGTTSAATAATLQYNTNTGTSTIDATVAGAQIRADLQDLGVGSSSTVDANTLRADAVGNAAATEISGNINPLLSSSELGQSQVNPGGMESGATVLASTMQINQDIDSPTALLTDSRIGLLATVDDPADAIVNTLLSVSDNLAQAQFTGNESSNIVAIDNGSSITLQGSAGVANFQLNLDNDADPFLAIVGDDPDSVALEVVLIEVGDYANDLGIADIIGSSVTFTGNDMLASVTASSAVNAVSLADGLNLDGSAVDTDQLNIAASGLGGAVGADLYVQNLQATSVGSGAFVGSGDLDPMLSVSIEDASGATITADANSIGSAATGNRVANTIAVGDTAQFSGLVGINTIQLDDAQQFAFTFTGMIVDVATFNSDGVVTGTGITADGNSTFSTSIGNAQSSSFDLTGTDVSGLGGGSSDGIIVDRTAGLDTIAADFSLMNIQLMDGENAAGTAGAVAGTVSTLLVQVTDQGGDVDSEFTDSSLSVSNNGFDALAIGNLSSEARIGIDATTFSGTIGVINDQTVQNEALLNAFVDDIAGGVVEVFMTPETIADASLHVDGNTLTTRIWGNLADATTNAISIKGVTVGDGDAGSANLPFGSVVRDGDFVSTTEAAAGITLVNDQSVEDLNDQQVFSSSDPDDFVYVEFGGNSADSSIADFTATANGNSGLSSAILNQATSAVTITATSLNGSTVLINTQTVADEDDDGASAGVLAETIDNDVQLEAYVGEPGITRTSLQIDDNRFNATSRANLASNAISVTAQTMTVAGAVSGADQTSVDLGDDSFARGEILLLNDQFIDSLTNLESDISDTDTYINAETLDGGSLTDSAWEVNGNAWFALSAGNDATNRITLDVGSFDLSAANADGGALNGPVATLASNQSGIDASEEINAYVRDESDAYIDLTGVGGDISGSELSVSGNDYRALGRTNNVVNSLVASGTVFDNGGVSSTPTVTADGDSIQLDETSFVVASRQINDFNVDAVIADIDISIYAYDNNSISDSALKVDNNTLVAEARGNDSDNRAALDFTTNGAQTFVVNVQFSTENDPLMNAYVDDIYVSVDANNDIGEEMSDTSVSVSGNALAGLASANRASNTLTATGTNVVSGSGAAPSISVDQSGGPEVNVTADFGIVNLQGAWEVAADEDNGVLVEFGGDTGVYIYADVDTLLTGAVSVDNNLMLAQGIDDSAVNILTIDASANVGLAGDTPGATIVSQQLISDGNYVEVFLENSQIGVLYDDTYLGVQDLSDAGSAAVSVQGNRLIGQAIGGTVTNTLRVTAGAGILGGGGTPTASMGDVFNDAVTLNADFTVLNVQLSGSDGGIDSDIDSEVDNNDILITIGSDMLNDTVILDGNAVSAQATGFAATNQLILNAGAASDTTAQLANYQGNAYDTYSTSVEGDASDIVITATIIDGGMETSSLSVSNNLVEGSGIGNTAINVLSTTAGATLQESSGAGVTIDPSDTVAIVVGGADYSVLNRQFVGEEDGYINGGVDGVTIGVDDLSGATGVNDSAVNVDGNSVLASANGNVAINSLMLSTGTFQHPSAAIATLQTTLDTEISADVADVSIGIGLGGGTISGASNNSTLTVRGNTVGATAIGNRSSSILGAN